eukprot:TRINITY_DN4154_c0_g1_i1.p1 TRINITY_DN4154_c0_g1~~TRINITY_DN4154_c0_g1_i1.p1  ORF type:complete len:274 (-),score=66.42 TRINITY_DN4154_c0_g1_i1:127-948(-)
MSELTQRNVAKDPTPDKGSAKTPGFQVDVKERKSTIRVSLFLTLLIHLGLIVANYFIANIGFDGLVNQWVCLPIGIITVFFQTVLVFTTTEDLKHYERPNTKKVVLMILGLQFLMSLMFTLSGNFKLLVAILTIVIFNSLCLMTHAKFLRIVALICDLVLIAYIWYIYASRKWVFLLGFVTLADAIVKLHVIDNQIEPKMKPKGISTTIALLIPFLASYATGIVGGIGTYIGWTTYIRWIFFRQATRRVCIFQNAAEVYAQVIYCNMEIERSL